MARFAAKGLNLSGFETPGGGASAGQAAGGGQKMADAWTAVSGNSPRWDKYAATSMATRAEEKATATAADAAVRNADVSADASIEAARLRADAQKEAAQKSAQGAMTGSAIGAVASIGAALLSDETTKNTIESIDNALATLRQLRPVTFYYNEEYSSSPERQHHGFIAQEYKDVLPAATYYDESIGKLAIDTGELIALLVRSVQQLEGRVAHMEATQALAGVK